MLIFSDGQRGFVKQPEEIALINDDWPWYGKVRPSENWQIALNLPKFLNVLHVWLEQSIISKPMCNILLCWFFLLIYYIALLRRFSILGWFISVVFFLLIEVLKLGTLNPLAPHLKSWRNPWKPLRYQGNNKNNQTSFHVPNLYWIPKNLV